MQSMTSDELRTCLASLDISQAQLAEELGLDQRTLREYVCEQTKIPNPVAILVRMRVRSFDDGIADKIRAAHKCQRVPISLSPAD